MIRLIKVYDLNTNDSKNRVHRIMIQELADIIDILPNPETLSEYHKKELKDEIIDCLESIDALKLLDDEEVEYPSDWVWADMTLADADIENFANKCKNRINTNYWGNPANFITRI